MGRRALHAAVLLAATAMAMAGTIGAGAGAASAAAGTAPAQAAEPTLTVTPTALPGREGTVTIEWANIALDGSMAIGQCVPITPERPTAEENCKLLAYVSTSSGSVTATVAATFMSFSGQTISCDAFPGGCAVQIGSYSPVRTDVAVPISFPPAVGVALVPDAPVVIGAPVGVDLSGLAPGAAYDLHACVIGPWATPALERCTPEPLATVTATADGTASATVRLGDVVDSPEMGRQSCRNATCGVGVSLADAPGIRGVAPYAVADAAVTLTPATGLVDGDAVAVAATGLRAGAAYRVRLCSTEVIPYRSESYCGYRAAVPDVVAGPDGTLATTIAVAQQVAQGGGDARTICRAEACSVAVIDVEFGEIGGAAPYVLAPTVLTAAPATGLADGAAVTLSGTSVRASYDGPPVWIFTSGVWGIVQCAAAVADEPTILGVFTHCAGAEGTGPLTVPGSTFATEVTVRQQITPVLGGSVDCAAAAGACVLAIARVEADGGVSLHTSPLTFGGG